MPLVAFLLNMIAGANVQSLAGEVWIAPAVVSCFALMSSAGLAGKVFGTKKRADAQADAKLQMDPDAYDVVGSRG